MSYKTNVNARYQKWAKTETVFFSDVIKGQAVDFRKQLQLKSACHQQATMKTWLIKARLTHPTSHPSPRSHGRVMSLMEVTPHQTFKI